MPLPKASRLHYPLRPFLFLQSSLSFGPPEAALNTARDAFRPDALGVAGAHSEGQTPGPLGPAPKGRGATLGRSRAARHGERG